jgi:hypothetical protein
VAAERQVGGAGGEHEHRGSRHQAQHAAGIKARQIDASAQGQGADQLARDQVAADEEEQGDPECARHHMIEAEMGYDHEQNGYSAHTVQRRHIGVGRRPAGRRAKAQGRITFLHP